MHHPAPPWQVALSLAHVATSDRGSIDTAVGRHDPFFCAFEVWAASQAAAILLFLRDEDLLGAGKGLAVASRGGGRSGEDGTEERVRPVRGPGRGLLAIGERMQ